MEFIYLYGTVDCKKFTLPNHSHPPVQLIAYDCTNKPLHHGSVEED